MSNRSKRRAIVSNQRGIALLVTLLALVVLLVLGVGMLQTSIASFRTSANDRMSKSALVVAESGIEYAREQLRTQLRAGPITLSQTLANAANHGTLVNATQFSAFNGSTGLNNYTTNLPLIGTTNFGSGSFQVFLTNDRCETVVGGVCVNQSASVQSTNDTNNRIMLTSLGTGSGGSLAAVQEQLKVFDAFAAGPSMPGAIVLPGPDIDFHPFTAEASQVQGCDQTTGTKGYAAIAVSSQAALGNALSSFPPAQAHGPCKDNYQTCSWDGTGQTVLNGAQYTFKNFLPSTPGSNPNPYEPNTSNDPGYWAGDPRLVEVAYLKKLVATIKSVADYTSTGAPITTLGTASAPVIAVIDNPGGEVQFSGKITGYGILLVTGQLTFTGTPTYTGMILCIGDGRFRYDGNGTGILTGSILVANINNPYNEQYVGIPYYHEHGGGAHQQNYDSSTLSTYANAIMPLQRLTFQQLR
jgi:Tfp pilus assembly protein PilX